MENFMLVTRVTDSIYCSSVDLAPILRAHKYRSVSTFLKFDLDWLFLPTRYLDISVIVLKLYILFMLFMYRHLYSFLAHLLSSMSVRVWLKVPLFASLGSKDDHRMSPCISLFGVFRGLRKLIYPLLSAPAGVPKHSTWNRSLRIQKLDVAPS